MNNMYVISRHVHVSCWELVDHALKADTDFFEDFHEALTRASIEGNRDQIEALREELENLEEDTTAYDEIESQIEELESINYDREVMNYWVISGWLFDRLETIGAPVLEWKGLNIFFQMHHSLQDDPWLERVSTDD